MDRKTKKESRLKICHSDDLINLQCHYEQKTLTKTIEMIIKEHSNVLEENAKLYNENQLLKTRQRILR